MDTAERVRQLVEPLVAQRGLSLYDVDHNGGVLKVLVDGPDGPDLDQLAELTRVVSLSLDEHDPVPGRYTLEVSSPGLERKLRTPEQFRSAIGDTVAVKTKPDADGDRRIRGVLRHADDTGVEIAGEAGETRQLPYDQIERAKTVFQWPADADKTSSSKKAARR